MSWNGSYASSFEKDLLSPRAPIRQKAVEAIRDVRRIGALAVATG